jgi:hypothetical protein
MSTDPYGVTPSDQPAHPEPAAPEDAGTGAGPQSDERAAADTSTSGPTTSGQTPPYGQAPPYGQVPPYGRTAYEQPPYGQAPADPTTPYGQPYGHPAGQYPYGQYPQQPYPAAQPGYGPGTDGLAIGSLISGIAGLSVLPLIASVVAVVLGVMSLSRIRASGQEGRGLAIAGIVLGSIGVVLLLLAIVVGFILFIGLAAAHHPPFVEFSSAV